MGFCGIEGQKTVQYINVKSLSNFEIYMCISINVYTDMKVGEYKVVNCSELPPTSRPLHSTARRAFGHSFLPHSTARGAFCHSFLLHSTARRAFGHSSLPHSTTRRVFGHLITYHVLQAYRWLPRGR